MLAVWRGGWRTSKARFWLRTAKTSTLVKARDNWARTHHGGGSDRRRYRRSRGRRPGDGRGSCLQMPGPDGRDRLCATMGRAGDGVVVEGEIGRRDRPHRHDRRWSGQPLPDPGGPRRPIGRGRPRRTGRGTQHHFRDANALLRRGTGRRAGGRPWCCSDIGGPSPLQGKTGSDGHLREPTSFRPTSSDGSNRTADNAARLGPARMGRPNRNSSGAGPPASFNTKMVCFVSYYYQY